ncbi:MAG: cell division protein FtsB [Pseudomonadota bacterium]|nr:cell division protein FtsB [Pseudomonadota bacterium]
MWFGTGGSNEVDALQAQVESQRRENLQLQQRNDALAAEVDDLKSGGAAVEERARSELGMVKPGETFYRVVDGQSGGSPPVSPQATPAPETGR